MHTTLSENTTHETHDAPDTAPKKKGVFWILSWAVVLLAVVLFGAYMGINTVLSTHGLASTIL